MPGYNATPMAELAMQLPMYTHGVPYALDWNDDGFLDLWHHNHYPFSKEKSRWSDPSMKRKGPRKEPGGCMVDWDAVFRDGETGNYYAPNDGKGFIEWTDKSVRRCLDVHSSTYLDFDGDGFKDLFLTTGGGRGRGDSFYFDNAIFWGEPADTKVGFKLVGGRRAASEADIEGRKRNRNEIGRHQYWLDANSDGLLDVIFLNQERADDVLRPGQLYLNNGDRTFKKVKPDETGYAEFTNVAMLTDVTGDGFGRELVVPSGCERRSKLTSPPQNFVCERSPRGTIAVYRTDPERNLVRETINRQTGKREVFVRALDTGDFDFDSRPDIAVMWGKKVNFHLSSSKAKRCNAIRDKEERRLCLHSLGAPDYSLSFKEECGGRDTVAMRFADFNLNGQIDMLVLCEEPGLHRIYELQYDGTWQDEWYPWPGHGLRYPELP